MSISTKISIIIVSFGLFVGRISGFIREVVIADQFGATENSDFIVLLLTTPDLFVSLLLGGAMSMALIPEFKSLTYEKGKLLYSQITSWLMLLGFLLCLVLFFFRNSLLGYLALGMNPDFIEQNSNSFFFSLLAVPFALSAGVSLAYLNAQHKFMVTSLGTLIVNLTVILFLFISPTLESDLTFLYISIGVIIAAFLRWLSQVVNTGTIPFSSILPSQSLISRTLIERYIYALSTGGIIFILPIVVRTVSSIEGEGTLSLINYTTKLIDLPLAVLISVFSVVFAPYLSEKFINGDEKVFKIIASKVFFLAFGISLLVTLPLFIFPSIFSSLLFGWGELTEDDLYLIGSYLSVFSLSLPFQGANSILVTIFSSRKDTKTPFVCTSFLGVVFYSYILIIKPEIIDLLIVVVVFYALLFFVLCFMLKFKHNIFIVNRVNVNDFYLLLCIILLSLFLLTMLKGIVFSLPLLFSSSIIFCYMLLLFILLFILYGRSYLNE